MVAAPTARMTAESRTGQSRPGAARPAATITSAVTTVATARSSALAKPGGRALADLRDVRCRVHGDSVPESLRQGLVLLEGLRFPGPLGRECEKCGRDFTASRSEVARGWGRFCSNECRRTRVAKTCRSCAKPMEVVPSKVAADVGVYCSVECRGVAKRNRVVRECAICGSKFERPASTVERSAAMYCKRDCLTIARREDPVEVERVRKMQRDHLASRAPTRSEADPLRTAGRDPRRRRMGEPVPRLRQVDGRCSGSDATPDHSGRRRLLARMGSRDPLARVRSPEHAQ